MNTLGSPLIPINELNSALMEMEFQNAQWYYARYAEACRACVESPAVEKAVAMCNRAPAAMPRCSKARSPAEAVAPHSKINANSCRVYTRCGEIEQFFCASNDCAEWWRPACEPARPIPSANRPVQT